MGFREALNALRKAPEGRGAQLKTVREPEPDELERASSLEELAQQVHQHHTELAQLRLEWAETLDKFTAWANRQAARDRVRMKRSLSSMDEPEEEREHQGSRQESLALSGQPEAPANGFGRHPKAELYSRIRRG